MSGPASGPLSGPAPRPAGDVPADRDSRDPAAQPERTRFAWRRTTLAFGIIVVLVIRRAAVSDHTAAGYAAGALTVLAWLAFLALGHHRIRSLAFVAPRTAGPAQALAAAGCVIAAAVCGAVVLL